MSVERPDHAGLAIDVETLGGTAKVLDSLRGLTDWAGKDNTGIAFGTGDAFGPASRLGAIHDKALQVTSGVIRLVDQTSDRYTDALHVAAETYGSTDKHSAAAVDAAAKGFTDTHTDPGE
ncbi:MAG: hypothetical protein ACRD0P_11650 [Stackebrandtia sp.]